MARVQISNIYHLLWLMRFHSDSKKIHSVGEFMCGLLCYSSTQKNWISHVRGIQRHFIHLIESQDILIKNTNKFNSFKKIFYYLKQQEIVIKLHTILKSFKSTVWIINTQTYIIKMIQDFDVIKVSGSKTQ